MGINLLKLLQNSIFLIPKDELNCLWRVAVFQHLPASFAIRLTRTGIRGQIKCGDLSSRSSVLQGKSPKSQNCSFTGFVLDGRKGSSRSLAGCKGSVVEGIM